MTGQAIATGSFSKLVSNILFEDLNDRMRHVKIQNLSCELYRGVANLKIIKPHFLPFLIVPREFCIRDGERS